MEPAQFRRFLSETLGNGVRASAEGAVHYVCMDWRHIEQLIVIGRELFRASTDCGQVGTRSRVRRIDKGRLSGHPFFLAIRPSDIDY